MLLNAIGFASLFVLSLVHRSFILQRLEVDLRPIMTLKKQIPKLEKYIALMDHQITQLEKRMGINRKEIFLKDQEGISREETRPNEGKFVGDNREGYAKITGEPESEIDEIEQMFLRRIKIQGPKQLSTIKGSVISVRKLILNVIDCLENRLESFRNTEWELEMERQGGLVNPHTILGVPYEELIQD